MFEKLETRCSHHKVCGAGGGGFVYCNSGDDQFWDELIKSGFGITAFQIEMNGSRIIYDA